MSILMVFCVYSVQTCDCCVLWRPPYCVLQLSSEQRSQRPVLCDIVIMVFVCREWVPCYLSNTLLCIRIVLSLCSKTTVMVSYDHRTALVSSKGNRMLPTLFKS